MAKEMAGAQSNTQNIAHPSRAARRWLEYTPDPADIDEAPRGVMTDDGNTVTMEDIDGTEIVVTFTAWEIKPLSPLKITASDATTVYLIY